MELPIVLLDAEVADGVIFFGRFHPLVVHLPIGFLLLAAVFEWMSRKPRYQNLGGATTITLFLGAVSALVSAIFGYMLSLGGGYNEDTLFWHQWLGIGLTVLAFAAYYLKVRGEKGSLFPKWVPQVMAIALLLLITLTGHLGGSLTHGSTYLTQYMPEPLRSIAGLPPKEEDSRPVVTNLDSAEVFADVVHPILKARCISCHNEDKKKGELLMVTYADIMKGGEEGTIIQVGNSLQSEIVRRVHLPEEDEKFMPPEGKTPLTEEQIAIIEWWINQGAPEKQLISELSPDENIRNLLTHELGLAPKPAVEALAANVSPPAEETVEKIRNQGFKVFAIAQDNPFIEVDFSLADTTLSNNQMKSLLDAKEQILWLSLSRSDIQDSHLEVVGQLPNLTRLKIDQTAISDAGIEYLLSLENLEYLNIYGTQVSDQGLEKLLEMPSLKKLYLWQSKVSPEAAEKAREKRPDMEINMGFEPQTAVANS